MSETAPRKRFLRVWGDGPRGLLAWWRRIEPAARLRERVQRGDLPLAAGLERLRRTAASIRPEGLLLDWGRRQLDLTPAAEAEWFHRAWWGLWAGRMFRDQIHSPTCHDEAMALIDRPPPDVLDRFLATAKGRILAGAHVGPPHAALAWLLERKLPLLAWTASVAPTFGGMAAGVEMLNPSREPNSLTLAALHLRRGGALFAAVDHAGQGRRVSVPFLKGRRICSTAIPALARRMDVPTERLLALWKGNRIVIDSAPVAHPAAGLSEESWNQAWIEDCWQPVHEIFRTSPENLRLLLFWSKGAIRREIGL